MSHKSSEFAENRLEVFLYSLKYNLSTLITVGAILLGFCLPSIGVIAVQTYMIENLNEKESLETIFNIFNTCNLLLIPCFCIASLGFAGCGQIIKNICWDEYINVLNDFKKGLKQNWKQNLLLFLIIGIINFSVGLNYLVLNDKTSGPIDTIATISVVLPILLFPIAIFAFNQIIIYEFKFLQILKHSIFIYISKLFKNVGFFLLTFLPYLLFLIPNGTFRLILICFIVLWYFPLQMEMFFLYSCNVFDNTINPNNFPEIINKGIGDNNKN